MNHTFFNINAKTITVLQFPVYVNEIVKNIDQRILSMDSHDGLPLTRVGLRPRAQHLIGLASTHI